MEILKQKKMILENDVSNITTRKNPDLTSGIYPTASKVSQYLIVAVNIRENKR